MFVRENRELAVTISRMLPKELPVNAKDAQTSGKIKRPPNLQAKVSRKGSINTRLS
jgi:hypothetical protein